MASIDDAKRFILGEIDLDNARDQVTTLQNWWGGATSKSPQLAYERLIDASRLAINQAYTMDGYLYGMYAETDGAARQFLGGFVDVMQRRLRLLPIWFTEKHKKAMFHLALDSTKDFCILCSLDDSAARRKWGYKTGNLLRVLGREVHDAMMDEEFDVDKCNDSESKERKRLNGFGTGRGQPCRNGLYCKMKKCCYAHNPLLQGQTADGFGKGEGIPCRYGTECNRPQCWFAHNPTLHSAEHADSPIDEGSGYVPEVRLSKTSLLDHLVESSGGLQQFKELCGLFYLSLDEYDPFHAAVTVDWPDAFGVQVSEAQLLLKQKADQSQPMAQCLLGILYRFEHVKVLGKSGAQETASIKLLTSSALAGNALVMFHLGMAHFDADTRSDSYAPTACLWWERAVGKAEIPLASFCFGAAYTAGPGGMPVNY